MESATPEVRDGTLTIRPTRENSIWKLFVEGELDLSNSDTLAEEIEKASAGGGDQVVLDIDGLDFIDSTGIALLVATHRRLNADGERFRLSGNPGEAVRRVMALTGLDSALPSAAEDS